MSFEHEFTVRFGEIDYARVVYYPRFFHIFHQTFEEWFGSALGESYATLVVTENLGFPAVHIETDFRRPLRYGDRISVKLELEEIGKKSMTCRYTVTRDDGEVAATARITTACIENDSFQAVEIPSRWRERLERYMKEQGSA